MGQAKQRGTFEERKSAAEESERLVRLARVKVLERRPSPKHTKLLAAMLAFAEQTRLK